MSAWTAGISRKATQIQNGISGVSSVAIREACPDGSKREPGAALHHHEKHRDQAAGEQAAPEQNGPGIKRQKACEERRRAPGNRGGDDEGNAETAFRTRLPHVDATG
ncbi:MULTISPECIES: hypothetical protein [Bradyrhizobium]|uniref:Uncharacterized protein n=1 Tax=Bradyrhizobium ottawaense TaxID=931866 RepID=A0ABV4G4Z0_9BRAD|nr:MULTISPECIES: hypothetical protein [Bradyrhizobium]MDA9420330.1 hypothetical protein [Bradyrhizobium sp. CCBAU 25360]MDA9481577.1 hypothetical protein [Bradyrhizobium sp. CCBAU 11445]MBR1288205.1 hypothetical protein [Bradyrhizobium ottawaense]MBR1363966.1 hypothetical protein [Bradyrhizobium ottawaense]WQN79730.1 hypothetical protein U7859_22175 [Bradyrhizobium ottawaense]